MNGALSYRRGWEHDHSLQSQAKRSLELEAIGMAFGFPTEQLYFWLTVGTLAFFALAAVLRHFESRRSRRLGSFVRMELAPRLLLGYDARMRRPLTWLTLLGFLFLGLALAQPHWGKSWQHIAQHSRDIVICVDTSESMNGEDILPSRMERARHKISALVDAAPGDRFGLIAFAGAAALQCPLTLDHGYFKAVLNSIDTDTVSLEGTDIAAALAEASNTLQEDKDSVPADARDTRAIVLVSDGEQVEGNVIEQAKEISKYARLYVMGVGDPAGAEVRRPTWMGRYLPVSEMSQGHVSKLDEETLAEVALMGGGRYVRSTPDEFDVNQLLEHLNGLGGRAAETDLRLRLVNRYQWPLAGAVLCFLAEGAWVVAMPWMRRRSHGREKQYA